MEVSLTPSKRFDVVDALRGFAIMTILLLHNLEHFDVYYFPAWESDWLKNLDSCIWDTLFFLFSGKSYSIFALLFGLTFYIQYSKRASLGEDFSGRFAWRMLWLLVFGMINTMFYSGDILVLYAIIGLVLIPVRRVGNRTLLIIAGILFLQPFEIGRIIYTVFHPEYVPADPYCYTLFSEAAVTQKGASFLEMVKGNLTSGRMASLLWCWDHGRFFQTAALFMLGFWLGRRKMFAETLDTKKFWTRVFFFSVVLFAVFFVLTRVTYSARPAMQGFMVSLFELWANLAMTAFWVSGFCLLYAQFKGRVLKFCIPLGKMSLTNYVFQSIVGALIYNGFALALYQYTGATYSLAIGILLVLLNWLFCTWWLKSHRQGILECWWHKITWINSK